MEEKEYVELLESIRFKYGYDFTEYSESSIKRRILRFMSNKKISAVDPLRRILLMDEALFEEFVQEMSVTVTEMFRDPIFYSQLRQKVTERLATYPVIKIWIAGCATGQEVYSMAIMLKEEGLGHRSFIYATDINQKSLHIAKEGVYRLDQIRVYTDNYLKAGGKGSFSNYYTANGNSVLFDPTLRENVVFSPHNLVTDESFNEFQLIMCRNVIMYFNHNLQNRVISLFYSSLCPFGYLAIGDKESLLCCDKSERFEEIDRKGKIYMKK